MASLARARRRRLTGLSGHVLVSEAEHVLSGLLGGSKVDLSALVDDEHLVKLVVDALSGLVQRRERRHLEHVRQNSQRLGVVERGGRVQSSGRVVPRGDAGAERRKGRGREKVSG